jgi:apolipoprotein N-acyltransferase
VDTQGVLPLPRLLALLSEPQPPETWEALRPRFAALNDRLFALTEREARAGARVVVWSEGNAAVLAADEAALLARAQAAARELEIELALAVAVWHPTGPHRLSNKVLWVRPTGALAWEYLKARPVPGPEADNSARGDGRMRTVDTAVGRYGVAICFDGDFPAQIRQARALGVDVVVSPSQDWPAITPQHSQMIAFRAIEDGVTYFRQTNRGLSLVTDPWGRTLGRMDHFAASDRVLVAQVPTRGVATVYGALGDWFPGVCLLGAVALVAQGLRTHRRRSERGGGALS